MHGLYIILAGFLWALDTLIRYPLLGTISAERVVFTEHLFLVILFLPFYYKNFKNLFDTKVSSIIYFVIIGVCGSAIGTLAFTKAFTLINPSLVILLQKLQPIVSIFLAAIFLKETIKKEFIIWGAVCLVGGILISSPDIFPNLSQLSFKVVLSQGSMLGYMLTLVAVVSWGASTVFGKKLAQNGHSEIQIMAGRFFYGFIFMSLYWYSNPYMISLDSNFSIWGKIFIMVVLAGLLGMYFYYKGLKLISAKVCALLEMFFPLSAVAINWIYLGNKLSPVQMIGSGLLILGSLIIQLKHL